MWMCECVCHCNFIFPLKTITIDCTIICIPGKVKNYSYIAKFKLLVMTCKALYNVTPFWLCNFAPHHFCLPLSYGVILSIFNFLIQISDFTSKTLNMLIPGIFCPLLPWRIPIHTSVLLLDVCLCVVSSGPGLYPQVGPRASLLVS